VAKVKSLVFQARSSLIETRKARAIPCPEIREQLATATGGVLRRRPLRRHIRACPGCAEFRDEVMRQRKALAAILPVVPTVGLKSSVLASIGFGSGGGGAAIGGGAAAAGSGIATLASSGAATKLATLVALGGLAFGGEIIIDGKAPSRAAEAKAGQGGSIQASLAPPGVTGAPTASHAGAARHLRTRQASGAPGSGPNVTAPGRGHATSSHGTKGRPVRTHAPQSPGSAPGATSPAPSLSGTTTTSPAPASTPNGNGNAGGNGQNRGWTSGRGNPHAQDSTGVRVPPGHQGEPTPAPAEPPTSAPGRSESAPGHTATAGGKGNGRALGH
jgi:hypothetical protein